MKKQKTYGGVLGRNLKHKSLITKISMVALFAIAFMVCGALFNDVSAAIFGGAATIGSLKFAAIAPMFYRSPEGGGAGAARTDEEILLGKIEDKVKGLTTSFAPVSDMAAIKTQLAELSAKAEANDNKLITTEVARLAAELKAISESPRASEKDLSFVGALRQAIKANHAAFSDLKSGKIKNLTIELKSGVQMNPTDIGQRTDYAQFLDGTNAQPVRNTFLRDLFRTIPTSREYVKFREQDVVTRDAKVVVACATSSHTTKLTWVNRTVQIQKVRDLVDVCLDMIDDYDFVQAEINQLVTESVKLKTDSEILNGTGAILSIDTISSEFDATNVLAPFDGTAGTGFKSPTLAELTAAMQSQITTFGQEQKWLADTILMNTGDWTRFMHEKDLDGNYLLPNFVLTNGGILNGMRVITNPLIAPNTLYVFDSTQGAILDRQMVTVDFAFENATNFEHEVVTIKAVERLQFLVKNIDQDAFMKCSDIAAALVAITNP